MKKNKDLENKKALQKTKENKEKLGTKIIRNIKSKWLIKGTNTLLLIAILIAVFILINSLVKYFDFTAIDCTTSQDYTLTDESKERVKDITQNVNIYFVGTTDTDESYILSKQYNKVNSNINVELIDVTENLDIANKYSLTSSDSCVIVENGDYNKRLESYDLYTYDSNYNTISIAEQKITSAILNVTSEYTPNVYFLLDNTGLSFDSGLQILAQYLDDEILTYNTLDTLSTGKIPDDCDTLVIFTPEKDFDDLTTTAITEYINNGGNILWLNSAVIDETVDYKNVNKILALYGVEKFEVGYIYESNSSNTILGYPTCFVPEVQSTTLTGNIDKVALLQSTKINLNEDKFEELNVEETDLILTSSTSYFTTDVKGTSSDKGEKGSYTVGAELVKTISEGTSEEDSEDGEASDAITSTLILYGDSYFITDTPLQYSSQYIYAADIYQNKDLMLNSIAYLTDKYEDITIRKSYSDSETTFTPTDGEKSIIMKIIFVVPIAVIAAGIVVWIIRKNKK